MARVLVIGGAGYVGSATCAWLLDRGHDVWVLDDLSTGHAELLLRLKGLKGFYRARAGDTAFVSDLLTREKFDCVMHFAAKSLVGESVAHPEMYYENNVLQTRALLESMLGAGVNRFIFSSTCAVFGDPGQEVARIHEALPKNPVNPYGATKLEAERVMEGLARDRGLNAIALRYFNAAGAEPQGRVGEWHETETHLIPRMLKAALKGDAVEIYGTDYPTPDGTCVRDYVHVTDLAAAHGAAMERLVSGDGGVQGQGRFEAYNLGSQNGFSVREMVAACERVIGHKLKTVDRPRRAGDPPRLVGDSRLAREVLKFTVAPDALERIFASAWAWEQKLEKLATARRAVFLDRDGTLNEDPGYLSDPAQLKLLPGVGEALARLKKAGFTLVVISNQSGVGRGLIRPDALIKIHERMNELLAPHGAAIDRYEVCIHRPEELCECRKPKSKLLWDAAQAMGLSLSRSYMVGDKPVDIQAGLGAGCKASLLVRTGYGAETETKPESRAAAFIGDSLTEVAEWVLGRL